MDSLVDLNRQAEWSGKPGEVKIPEAYIKGLHFEIVVFTRKERGGSDFTFRCRDYERGPDEQWVFEGVVMDTSKRNQKGEVELVRLTYHPDVVLVNAAFMVIQASEDNQASEDLLKSR